MRCLAMSALLLAACAPHHAPIEDGAVTVMTADRWPTMLAQLGPEAFARANAKMRAAAEYGARDSGCQRVEYVGVSQSGSSAQRIEWFVDCPNEYRVRLSEDDLPATG